MIQIKICPDCASEYSPHIANCADCGAPLISPEENKKVQEERKRLKDKALENAVKIREGDLKWMGELYHVLIDSNIPCTVSSDDGCNKGCCGSQCHLMVSAQDVERANERIEEYYAELHPEIQESKQMMSQGKCPACGHTVGSDASECQDCGLPLVIIEE